MTATGKSALVAYSCGHLRFPFRCDWLTVAVRTPLRRPRSSFLRGMPAARSWFRSAPHRSAIAPRACRSRVPLGAGDRNGTTACSARARAQSRPRRPAFRSLPARTSRRKTSRRLSWASAASAVTAVVVSIFNDYRNWAGSRGGRLAVHDFACAGAFVFAKYRGGLLAPRHARGRGGRGAHRPRLYPHPPRHPGHTLRASPAFRSRRPGLRGSHPRSRS